MHKKNTNYLEKKKKKLSQVRRLCGLSHFNRVEVAIIIVVFMQSRHGWLTFQVVIICPCRLELRIVSRQPLTFGHDVKEEMESVPERLGADAPAVVLPGVNAFAKVRLGERDGNEPAATAQYVAHLQSHCQKFKWLQPKNGLLIT